MSNIRDLFSKKLHVSKVDKNKAEVESKEYIAEKKKEREQFVPPIDFASASNYIRFGSAKEYYANSIKRIYNTYPYDGSEKEKLEFRNDSTELDKWMFDTKYPKASGHAVFDGTSHITINRGYQGATTPETTKLAKLFNTKVVKHDAEQRRKQTFAIDLNEGITVEWWMKKPFFYVSSIEGIFSLSSSQGYIDIFAYGVNPQPLLMHASGSDNSFTSHNLVGTSGITTTTIADNAWHHYAVSLYREDSVLKTNLYIDGISKSIQSVTDIGEITDSPTGRIGIGLDVADIGLRANIDDFRFWNKRQSSEAIYNNYYRAIGGGSNSDDNRTELSVYFKFNEGTVGQDETDRIVLDYSGRIANGYWENYTSACRAEGSAYTTDGDPIIRSTNSLITDLETEMELSGTRFDSNNNMSLFDLYPQWIQEEDNGELKKLTQIIAAYFDDLYTKIEYLPNLKDKRYFKDNEKALPFAKRLLEEKGLIVPDILVERSVLEFFGQRDLSKVEFEKDIEEVKNKIYQNIYNNIEYIYKSKGTEKAYRNLLRCFGIDDEVVKLNLYTDNGTQYLVDKTKHTSEKTKHIDFDDPDHFSATVYQENYISGSGTDKLERYNAITAETEVLVPRKPKLSESWYYSTPFQSSSVFGLDAANDAGTGYDTTITGSNFQAYLVKDRINSDRAKWVLERNTIVQTVEDAELDLSPLTFLESTVNETNSGNGFAFSFWFNPDINEAGAAPTTGIIRLTFADGKNLHLDYTGLPEQVRLKVGGLTSSNRIAVSPTNPYNVENFIVCTTQIVGSGYTTNSEWTLYYYSGGVSQSTTTKGDSVGTTNNHPDLSTLTNVDIGSFANMDTFDGTYDDIMIWDKHLSATDVQNLFDLQSGADPSNTILTDSGSVIQKHWKFAESLTSEDSGATFTVTGPAVSYVNQVYASTATGQILLESPFYDEIYNNQRWNVAVRVSPEGYPFAGSFATSSNGDYNVEFYGVTHNMDEVLHEFDLSTTFNYETGSALLSANKRLYIGARRDTWTGTVEARSDLKFAAASVYYDRLDNQSIKQHNLDPSNYGHNRVHSNPTPFIKDMENTNLPAQHALALHWDFQTVTSSDSSGEFVVEDFSSASSEGRYGWLDEVVTNEHRGIGYGFPVSTENVVRNEFIFASKKELPEISFTSDSVQIIGDEENFLYEDEDVNDNVFAFEKSLYQAVSEEMLNIFSTITEYANLISKPVDRYRMDYKRLALARQLFFEKVDGNMDLDRFTDYFKWVDASISVFLQQLHPANAKFNKGIADMVESHILERPKYQHIYPLVEKQTEIKPGQITGPAERLYDWKTGHAPAYKLDEYNERSVQIEVGSYLKHSEAANYNTNQVSVAFWINISPNTPSGILFRLGADYYFSYDGTSNLQVFHFPYVASIPITPGTDYFVVIVLDKNNSIEYSIDNGALTNTSIPTPNPTLGGAFAIGFTSIGDRFDEISIWDKALTQQDITSIYNGGTAVDLLTHTSASNLMSYYRMGDHPDDPEIRPFQGYSIKDSTGNYDLQVKGTWSSYAEPLAGSFKIEQAGENIHCLWQKERKEQTNITRQFIQKALTTEAKEIELTFGDNSGNSYGGSTYASRRFAKPYRFKGEEQRTIHGGINYAPSKDRDFLKSATQIHGKISSGPTPVPQEVVTVGAGLAQGLVDQNACDDPKPPTKKEKLASNAVLGKYSNYAGTGPVSGSLVDGVAEFAYSVKGERILPMNIIEGTSITGYNETVHYNFREDVIITNLHSDTTSPTNDIPMQGPFTETWVGGRQSRHAPVNRGTDNFTTRPEEWRLLIGEHEVDDVVDGALGFTGPDYGGPDYPNPDRAMAIYYRDERAKRPINAANRKTTDLFQGNYSENYEVVQTVGRLENNKVIKDLSDNQSLLAKDIGLPSTTHETTFLGVVPGSYGNTLSQNSNRLTSEIQAFPTWSTGIEPTKTVFASRFSAPGGFDVMSEAYLDSRAKEYSVYNSINFRNYSVIEDSGEQNATLDTRIPLKAIRSPSGDANLQRIKGNATNFPTTGSKSISFWVKLDNTGVLTSRIALSSQSFNVRFLDNKLRFTTIDNNIVERHCDWPVPLTTLLDWNLVLLSWDGDFSNDPELWINAELQGSPTTSGNSTSTTLKAMALLSFLDRHDNPALFTTELQGSLMQATIWNVTFTTPEAVSLYNSGQEFDYSSSSSDILLHYKLGEESQFTSIPSGGSISSGVDISPTIDNIGVSPSHNVLTTSQGLLISDGAFSSTNTVTIPAIGINSHNNRREGLNTLHQRHCGKFGLDSTHGAVSVTDYDAESSFHKIHRNTLIVPTSGSTRDIHNNFYVQTPIPASDYNYSWVTSSLGDNYSIRSGTQKVYGYWPKTGILSSSSGFDSAIVFPTASEIFGS